MKIGADQPADCLYYLYQENPWGKGKNVGESKLTPAEQVTNYQTMRHIETVRNLLSRVIVDLLERAEVHDQSKMESPEVEAFTEFTPKLAASTYGSPEYEGFRKAMGDALNHHYAKNRHHPEHYPRVENAVTDRLRREIANLENQNSGCEGTLLNAPQTESIVETLKGSLASTESPVNGMTLLDLIEMFCDWKAATLRHNDGNLLKSVEINAKRFGLSEQLKHIFQNTAKEFDW